MPNRTEIATCPPRKMPPVIGRIVCGDNCDVMGRFPADCIDLVVTSPPYDNLRDYGGHEWDFYGVAWQLKRVLKPGGVIVWVVGDGTVDGGETGSSMRQAMHFQQLGLSLHDTMIYQKSNFAFPSEGRYHQLWEYMFVFAKGSPGAWNPIKDKRNTYVGQKPHGVHRTKDGSMKETRKTAKATGEYSQRGNIWRYVTGGGHVAENKVAHEHPAIFPEALAADHIKTWSNEGELVLDPFCGSGTTTAVACKLKRQFIGIDVDPTYCELAVRRMGEKGFFT